jgi:hypothetical protein
MNVFLWLYIFSAETAEGTTQREKTEMHISPAFSLREFLSALCAKTWEIFTQRLVQFFFFFLGENPFLFDVDSYECIQAHIKISNPNE